VEKENLLVDISFQFALEVIDYTEVLESRKRFNMANQLFRSGTSIGANIREAQGSESRADFIHKMKVAYKEAEETKYWLELCLKSPSYPDPLKLMEDLVVILKVLGKIISSSKH
jgi:four helix bundle protein